MKTMKSSATIRILLGIFLLAGLSGPLMGSVRFGPYEALTINADVIRGVKVDDDQKIWLLLNPTYLDREIIVKISMGNGSGYREWHHGGYELVSPAKQDKRVNQWTDWVQVKSPFIEYWMNDQLILHLKKVE